MGVSLAGSLGGLDWSLTMAGRAGIKNRTLSRSPEAEAFLPQRLVSVPVGLRADCRSF